MVLNRMPSLPLPPPPEFAPISVPWPRRMQTLSIITWILLTPGLVGIFFLLASHQYMFYAALGYLIFVYLDPAPSMCGRKSMWVRKWTFWKLVRDFFPIKIQKTVDLDPSKNYVFGYHPHGIIGVGAMVNFGTEANYFSSLVIIF